MTDRTRMLRATVLAAPLGALALLGQVQAQDSDVPASPHQEQVLQGQQSGEGQGSQQLSTEQPGAQGMPSSPHQEQVLQGQQGEQPAAAQPGTGAQESDMPASPHQEQVLRGEQQGDPAQPGTGAQGSDMPASPHQEQVLPGGQGG